MSGIGLEKSPAFVKGERAIRGTDRGPEERVVPSVIQPHPSLAPSLSLWSPSTDISDSKPTQTFELSCLNKPAFATGHNALADLNCRLLLSVKNNGWHIVVLAML